MVPLLQRRIWCLIWCAAACGGGCDTLSDDSGKSTPTSPPQVAEPSPAPAVPTASSVREVSIAGQPIHFVRIDPATFVMLEGGKYMADGVRWKALGALAGGSLGGGPRNEGPPRSTTISKAYWIALEPVDWEQYVQFMKSRAHLAGTVFLQGNAGNDQAARSFEVARGTKTFRAAELDPASDAAPVPWNAARSFCAWVQDTQKNRARLPSEAEWELFARRWENAAPMWLKEAGCDEPTCSPLTAPQGEWTNDRYARLIDENERIDPVGPAKGDGRVIRYGVTQRYRGSASVGLSGEGIGARIRLVMEEPEEVAPAPAPDRHTK